MLTFHFLHNFEISCSPQGNCGLDVLGGRRHRVRRQLRLNLHSLASICWKVVPVVVYYLTILSCNIPKATISEAKIDLKTNLWFQVVNAKQIIISISLICVKLFFNIQSIFQPADSACLHRHMLRHHRARSHQHQSLCQGDSSHLYRAALCLLLISILNRLTLEEV